MSSIRSNVPVGVLEEPDANASPIERPENMTHGRMRFTGGNYRGRYARLWCGRLGSESMPADLLRMSI